jgi:hypothetical protein
MSTPNDHYSVLGVLPTSDDVVIKGAYRALMLKYHPDNNRTDAATAHATRINEAYATLGDPAKRAAYDREHRRRHARQTAAQYRAERNAAKASGVEPRPKEGPGSSRMPATTGGREDGSNQFLYMIGACIALVGMGALSNATNSRSVPETRATTKAVTGARHVPTAQEIAGTAPSPTRVAHGQNVTSVFGAAAPPAQPAPLAATAAASDISYEEAPVLDPMDRTRAAPPLDFAVIEAAARDVDRAIRGGGLAEARIQSQRCHEEVQRRLSWSLADRCAAYDYAVRLIDVQVSQARGTPNNAYFRFREDNLPDMYATSSLGADLVRVRLQRIRKAATATAFQVLQERLDERAREAAGSNETVSTGADQDVPDATGAQPTSSPGA